MTSFFLQNAQTQKVDTIDSDDLRLSPEELADKGLEMIGNKLYLKGAHYLEQALDAEPGPVLKKLLAAFQQQYKIKEFESAYTTGKLLAKKQPENYELLNKVGNCARRIFNTNESIEYYKKALKANKTFEYGLLNLAAAMGEVEKYDQEAKEAVSKFSVIQGFVLPEYFDNPNLISEIKSDLVVKNQEETLTQIDQLKKKLINENLDPNDKEHCKKEINRLRIHIYDPTPQEIIERLKWMVKHNWKDKSLEEGKITIQKDSFNLGLYALSQKDGALALETFEKLKAQGCVFENLEMMIGLSKCQMVETEQAVEIIQELMKIYPNNRYLNANLGMIYQENKNRLMSYRYFLKTTALLEKSKGIYDHKKQFRKAEVLFKQKEYKAALELYQEVTTQTKDTKSWQRIIDINIGMKKYNLAARQVVNLKELIEDAKESEKILGKYHDKFFALAKKKYHEKKLTPSIRLLELALKIQRRVEAYEMAAKIYKSQNNDEFYDLMMKELSALKKQNKEHEFVNQRQKILEEGKTFLQNKDYFKAIDRFKEAFELKPDKDAFMFLAHIYKALKHNNALNDLLLKWKSIQEYEEKRKKYIEAEAAAEPMDEIESEVEEAEKEILSAQREQVQKLRAFELETEENWEETDDEEKDWDDFQSLAP